MMHLLCKYDVAPIRSLMMRCLPEHISEATSSGAADIISATTSFAEKANIIEKTVIASQSRSFHGGR